MQEESDHRLDHLWEEHRKWLDDYDDLTLVRMRSQILSQMCGGVWRLSHPLVGMHRLVSRTLNKRGTHIQWIQSIPSGYTEAACCGAPLVPLITRDLVEGGIYCEACGQTALHLADLPPEVSFSFRRWAESYATVHDVAHMSEEEVATAKDYEADFQAAAEQAEDELMFLGTTILPHCVSAFSCIVWQDHDECLRIWPEDLTQPDIGFPPF